MISGGDTGVGARQKLGLARGAVLAITLIGALFISRFGLATLLSRSGLLPVRVQNSA